MSTSFDPTQDLVKVMVRISGPTGITYAQLALDTGATITTIRTAKLVGIGYDPAISSDRLRMTTASGVEYAPRLLIDKIEALDQERTTFPVIAHTLPPSATVGGLLGLDFFRDQELLSISATDRLLFDNQRATPLTTIPFHS